LILRKVSLYPLLFFLVITGISLLCGCGGGGASGSLPNPTPVPSANLSGTVYRDGNPTGACVVFYSFASAGSALSVSSLPSTGVSAITPDGPYSFTGVTPGAAYIAAWESEADWRANPAYPRGGIAVNITEGTSVTEADITWGILEALPVTLPAGTAVITGKVTDASYESPVAGSTVMIWEGGLTATTDAKGDFTFNNLPTGYYTIIITASGYGQSRAQAVKATEGSTTELEMIQMPYSVTSWSVVSPVITVSGVNDGDGIDAMRNISVSASGEREIASMAIRVGNRHNTPDKEVWRQSLITMDLVPSSLPPGSTYLYITAYDDNNNRTEMTINLNIYGPAVTPPSGIPNINPEGYIIPYAVTVGESWGYYKKEACSLMIKGELPSDFNPNILYTPEGKAIDASTVPDDAVCYVALWWVYNIPAGENLPEGFRIYRSGSQTGTFELIGERLVTEAEKLNWPANGDFSFIDADSRAIYPGQTVFYRISAFNSGGEGPLSDVTPETTILDVFRVYLTSPADTSTGISKSPTLAWSISGKVGVRRWYQISLWPYNDGLKENYYLDTDVNPAETSVTITGLEANEVYQWDVLNAEAMGSENPATPGKYHARSWPTRHYLHSQAIWVNSSNNGAFTFTTGP